MWWLLILLIPIRIDEVLRTSAHPVTNNTRCETAATRTYLINRDARIHALACRLRRSATCPIFIVVIVVVPVRIRKVLVGPHTRVTQRLPTCFLLRTRSRCCPLAALLIIFFGF